MGSTVEKIRVRQSPKPRLVPTSRPPALRGRRRVPAGLPRPIPKAAFDAFRLARRRRLVARRVAGVFAPCFVAALFSFGAYNHGSSTSERGYVRPVSPVEAAALLLPSDPPPPDMGKSGPRRWPGMPRPTWSDALPAFRRVAWEQGLFPVMWTVDPGDYLLDGRPEGAVRGVERADEAGRKGEGDGVVLLHDNQRQTAEALPAIIDRYEGSGRSFAGVDELLADKYLGAGAD